MRAIKLTLGLIGGLVSGWATADPGVDQALAEAQKELKAVQAVGHEWQLVDKATGSGSAPLSKLLEAAKKAKENGDNAEAMRIAKRVAEAAKLGQQQAAEQSKVAPHYPK